MKLKIKKLRPDVKLPEYGSAAASGLDLHANISKRWAITEGAGVVAIPTGISVEIPEGFEGQVRPRSGMVRHHGVVSVLGTIDSDYRGEIYVLIYKIDTGTYLVEPNERVAQLVIAPVVKVTLEEVTKLDKSERGEKGFGSTGRFEVEP